MNSHEIAWAAGLFDGEGSVFAANEMKRGRRHVRLHMAVRMTTLDDIKRFHRAVGVGAMSGPYQPKGDRKLIWAWQAGPDASARYCIDLLWPYLGKNKRAQATDALKARDHYLANPEPRRLRKAVCRRGHDQSIHRRFTNRGISHGCSECQRITYAAWRDRKNSAAAFHDDAPLITEATVSNG